MKLNSVSIMEKTIIILKMYMFSNMSKFDTDYKNAFDNYVYYVICHLFTTLGRLTNWTSRFVD
jgi:hypothetical protein